MYALFKICLYKLCKKTHVNLATDQVNDMKHVPDDKLTILDRLFTETKKRVDTEHHRIMT